MEFAVIIQHIDAGKAEARVTHLAQTQPRHSKLKVTHGVVVGSAVLLRDVAHSLARRLAEADTHTHGRMVARHTCDNLQCAVQLTTKVKQYSGMLLLGAAHNADVRVGKVSLTHSLTQEIFGMRNLLLRTHPHDALWRDVLPHARVALLRRHHLGAHHRQREKDNSE